MPDNEKPNVRDEYQRSPDFFKYYANNVRFETSAWDLLMTFGELAGNLPEGVGSAIEQKVAIRMSWAQAKVMAIFLAINVADHEISQGAERVPAFVFGEPLKHLGDKDLTLQDMFADIIKAVNQQKKL